MDLYAEIAALVAEGQPFVLATVIESAGSTPQKPGSKMVVLSDGSLRGTVGGGAIELQIIEAARALLEAPEQTRVIETHLIPYAQFCGIPPAPSALAFGILMGVNTLAMVAAGWLTDRMNRAWLKDGVTMETSGRSGKRCSITLSCDRFEGATVPRRPGGDGSRGCLGQSLTVSRYQSIVCFSPASKLVRARKPKCFSARVVSSARRG